MSSEDGLCRTLPRAGDVIGARCPDCGHLNVMHVEGHPCIICDAQQLLDALRSEVDQARLDRARAEGASG